MTLHCLVPPFSLRPMRFGITWSIPLAASPKCIGQESLKRRLTDTRQDSIVKLSRAPKSKHSKHGKWMRDCFALFFYSRRLLSQNKLTELNNATFSNVPTLRRL